MPRVNPDILSWARETAGLNLEEAVKKIRLHDAYGVAAVDRLAALEGGEDSPTRPMLVKMATQYRRPLLTFYLPAPPPKGDRGSDFRTLPEDHSDADEALLDALLREIVARQSLVREAMEDEDVAELLPFVGSASEQGGVAAVLASIRGALGLPLQEYRAAPDADEAFKLLRAHAERIGVFVLLIGDLGSHHTSLGVGTFRGFALADPVAPFIVINDQDARPAWSFTLLHELTHLWLGQTGVSGGVPQRRIEQFCNDVASEFLLPAQELVEFDLPEPLDADRVADALAEFAGSRRVSRSMVAYKMFRRGYISADLWQELHARFRTEWLTERRRRRQRAKEGNRQGPSYYVLRQHRIGAALIRQTARLMEAGALTTAKAGRVLGVRPQNVQSLIDAVRPSALG